MGAHSMKLLLVLVIPVAAVQFFFGYILNTSPFRLFLYTPGYNTQQSTVRLEKDKSDTRKSHSDLKRMILINVVKNKNNTVSNFNVTLATNVRKQNVKEIIAMNQNVSMKNNVTVTESLMRTPSSWGQLLENNTSITIPEQATAVSLCDNNLPDLGPIQVNKTELKLEIVEKRFPEVHWGGKYFPPNCTARHKVAIIVPFRYRQQHLPIFLNHIHPFLIKQQIEYGIFIIEQTGKKAFNRGKLMNVGFAEAQKLRAGGWQCFIFHDIDLLPLDTRNVYSCASHPRHMAVAIDTWKFKILYEAIFGGVSALSVEQFTKVNGFSNNYWGWGGEDDDISSRLRKQNYHILRYNVSIARYMMLRHKATIKNPKRWFLLSHTSKKEVMKVDGLSSLKYELLQIRKHHLYTHILVNIDERI